MNEDILRMFSRIAQSADGIELLEYLKKLSYDNYEAYKKDDASANEIHKGYAIAIDSLIKLLEQSSEVLSKRSKVEQGEWL